MASAPEDAIHEQDTAVRQSVEEADRGALRAALLSAGLGLLWLAWAAWRRPASNRLW